MYKIWSLISKFITWASKFHSKKQNDHHCPFAKLCTTCKHLSKTFNEEPCVSCIDWSKENIRTKWEESRWIEII